jgi:hypothetical protein
MAATLKCSRPPVDADPNGLAEKVGDEIRASETLFIGAVA